MCIVATVCIIDTRRCAASSDTASSVARDALAVWSGTYVFPRSTVSVAEHVDRTNKAYQLATVFHDYFTLISLIEISACWNSSIILSKTILNALVTISSAISSAMLALTLSLQR